LSPYAPTLPNGKILEKRRREYRFRAGNSAAPFSKASRALLKFGESALRLVGRTLVVK